MEASKLQIFKHSRKKHLKYSVRMVKQPVQQ